MRTRSSRIAGLDVLRGCAAVAVMLHHHGQYYDVLYPGRTPLAFDLGPGHFGVELFFIISGFVIIMTIDRKKTVRAFALARVIRLMPTFLATLLLATALLTLWPMPPLDAPTVPQFAANLTMAPSLFGQREIDLPYWTLTYELLFYVYMAMILRFGLLRSIEWLGLLSLIINCIFLTTVDVELHRRSSIVLLVHYSNFFLIGICLYRIYAGAARPLTYLVLGCSIAMTALGGGERAFYSTAWIYLPLTAAFAALVWLATSRHGQWFAWPPLVFLGRISYPLYLVHCALGFTIIRLCTERGWSTLGSLVAALIASFAAAVLLHYLVEVPCGRLSAALSTHPPAPVT